MKKNDLALFFFPASIAIITVLSAIILVQQFSKFEKAYLREATDSIIQKTDLATQIITPFIESENMEEAKEFCLQFSDQPSTLRLKLIDSQGNVLSDTKENSEIFDNHLLRPEVQKALAGTPEVQIRYSSTLNQQMIYYAKPINSASGKTYILRVAETNKHVQEILSLAKLNLFFALLLGAAFITLLILYIVHRVRRPLVKLQESAVRITQGYLDEKIFIPNSGIIRDLAINLREMEEKLREQLEYVTHENTERELIYQTMGEAILIINRDGEVLSHNHAADHLFGIQQSTPSFNINRAGSTELI
jgi:two-component system phosphate regulon sensor histidine kinase PhoR